MTQKQTDAITRNAKLAAESSIEAHGEAVSPAMAWDFIINMLFETGDDDYSALPESMPDLFRTEYFRESARIMNERGIA